MVTTRGRCCRWPIPARATSSSPAFSPRSHRLHEQLLFSPLPTSPLLLEAPRSQWPRRRTLAREALQWVRGGGAAACPFTPSPPPTWPSQSFRTDDGGRPFPRLDWPTCGTVAATAHGTGCQLGAPPRYRLTRSPARRQSLWHRCQGPYSLGASAGVREVPLYPFFSPHPRPPSHSHPHSFPCARLRACPRHSVTAHYDIGGCHNSGRRRAFL